MPDDDLDVDALAERLRERFGGGSSEAGKRERQTASGHASGERSEARVGEAETVARQARDLADDGRLVENRGTVLTVETVLSQLADAPDGGPAERWNWWLGALDVAYGGGYREFQVQRYPGEE